MGRKNYKIVSAIPFLVIFLAACKKDIPKPSGPGVPADPKSNKVYVVCEGNMGTGNSALSIYEPTSLMAYEDVYLSANDQQIGDVFQSIQRIGDSLFLCINNSDKILVINRKDNKLAGTINIPKPRYILPISENKAYVSTIFSDKVYIIDPKKLSVTGSITMPAQNPEGMLLANEKAYICCWDTASNKVYQLNAATDKIENEIEIAGRAPQEIAMDKDGALWVLSGNVAKGKQATLTRLKQGENSIISSFQFPEKADPLRLVFNSTKEVLYFIEVNYNGETDHNGVYKMRIEDSQLPVQPFIAARKFQYFWALGIEPITDRIFVGDPKGFIQRGSVSIYNEDGSEAGKFTSGVGPGHFYFDYN